MCYKSILVMRSIPELLQGPPDSPSLGVSRHLLRDASGSSSSSSSDNEIAPYARAKSLPPSPVTHSPLLHPRGFLRPSASLPEETEVHVPPPAPSLPVASPVSLESQEVAAGVPGAGPLAVPGCVPRQSIIRSLFYQQAGEGSERGCPPSAPGSRKHLARARQHLLKGGYIARVLPGLREPLMEHRALEEQAAREEQTAREEQVTLMTKVPSCETALRLPSSTARVVPGRSRSLDQDQPRTTSPFSEEPRKSPEEPGKSPKDYFEGQCPHPAPWGLGEVSQDSSVQGPSPFLLREPTATLHTGAWALGTMSSAQAAPGSEEGSVQGSKLLPSTDGNTGPTVSQDSSQKQPTVSLHCDWGSAPQEGCGPPAAAAPQLPGSFPPGSHAEGFQIPGSPFLSGQPQDSPSQAQASPLSGSKQGAEPSPSCSIGQAFSKDLSPQEAVPPAPVNTELAACPDDEDLSQETAQHRPLEQATTRKFSLECHGGYAGVAGYGTFAFGGDAGGMLGQGPMWAKMAWVQRSQSWEEQEEAVAESPLPLAGMAPVPEGSGPSPRGSLELTSWEDFGQGSQVSLVQIKDLSGDSEAADTLSLDISEVEPAYLNLSDLYDIKYLPFEFMIFRKVPKPPVEREPSSTLDEDEGLAELPEAVWPWLGELGPPASLATRPRGSLQITEEEPEDMEALLGEAALGRKRKVSPSSRGFFQLSGGCLPLEESQEHSLRKRVKASVAHISRILTGRAEDPEKEGLSRKKLGLASFRLKSKDRAPSFLKELSDETVVLGQPVTLACQVSAQPVAKATWSKDGAVLESSSRILISSTLKHFQLLTILVVTAEDLGVYTCSVSNALGTAATTGMLRRAELPSSSPRPDIGEVYADGVLLVWKPVETCGPVTYIVQCCLEGGSWSTLASDIFDCCYLTSKLPRAGSYTFRTACVSKAGMGPYSRPSEQVILGGPSHMAYEESGHALPAQPLSSTQTFAFQTQIRRGRFSVVRQCREKGSGRILAAKIIPYRAENKTAVLGEYEALKGLRHLHLVQLLGAYLSPRHLVLILELCSGPELLPCLAERASYSESEVKDYLWQMLSAAQYLHSQGILHLDLRSENLIVTEYNLLKVLDFGNAQSLAQEKVLPSEKFKDFVETMAPELLEGQGAVPQTDIWAIGVTAFIMLSGEYPVSSEGARDLQKALRKGVTQLSRCYAGLSGGAVAFLRSTLCAHPWGRPCASSCLHCGWLTEEGLANSRPTAVTFSTARLRAFVREREKRRALLYKKYNLAQVR